MTGRTKLIIGVLVGLVLAAAAYLSTTGGLIETKPEAQEPTQQTAAPQVGFLAPDFELTGFDGKRVKLSALQGKPVVLNFWASWCGPCKREMPDLEAMHKQYGDRVHFYGVNLTSQDDIEKAFKFISEMGVTFPNLQDISGDVSKTYRIFSVPTTYAVGADGKISEIWKGELPKATMDGMLQRLTK